MPSIGTSIVVIAAGAILRYAVTANVEGVSLRVVGLILIILGGIGLFLSVIYMFAWGPWHRRAVPPPADERRDRYYEDPTHTY
jgi:hypothetical protein